AAAGAAGWLAVAGLPAVQRYRPAQRSVPPARPRHAISLAALAAVPVRPGQPGPEAHRPVARRAGRAVALASVRPGPGPARLQRPARRPDQVQAEHKHTSELQSRENLVCRLLLEKKKYDWCRRGAGE